MQTDEDDDDQITDHKNKEPRTFKHGLSKQIKVQGERTLGLIYKVSNLGWSQNPRLLYLDKNCLSYFSKVPSDFNAKQMVSAEVFERKAKPKLSIAIEYLLGIEMLSEEE